MNSTEWTEKEKRLVVATAVAPLAVSIVVAALATIMDGSAEALFLLLALVPAAYLTLFAFVLPSLWLLRRTRKESAWSFSGVCGLSVIAPWFLLYFAFFGEPGSAKYGGAPVQVLAMLLVPGGLATIVGATIYSILGSRQESSSSGAQPCPHPPPA